MNRLIDILQIVLANPLTCSLAGLLIVVTGKMLFVLAFDALRGTSIFLSRYMIRPTLLNGVLCAFFSCSLIFFHAEISDALQAYEQTQLNPVYEFDYTPNEADAVRMFESEIQKNVGQKAFEIVKAYTQKAADTLGCTPLTVYQIALSECGLNPFAVHRKGCAAGWMQLTVSGCKGLMCNGEPVTLEKAKAACGSRDIEKVMQYSNAYLVDRAKGRKIEGMKDFYLLVFAPAFVGASDGTVLYQGKDNPAYYLNDVFDGYFVDAAGRICRLNSSKDYKITVGEVYLHVKRKYINFVNSKR